MKFTCPSEAIIEALVPLATYVTSDIISLELQGNELRISISARDVGGSVTLIVHGEESGEVDLPMSVVAFFKKMPEGRFVFELIDSDPGDYVMMTCGKSKFKSATMRGGVVTRVDPPDPKAERGRVKSSDIARVSGAASPASNTAWATGVYFDNDDGQAVLVATDSVSLARINTLSPTPEPVIVPVEACRNVARVGGEWEVEVRSNVVLFVRDGFTFWTSVIKSSYPNYKFVIPDPDVLITADKKELLDALSRLSISDDGQTSVRLDFSYGSPIVMSLATSTSASREEVDISSEPFDDFTTYFTVRGLTGAVKAAKADKLRIGWSGVGKPLTFGSDADDITYIMQPIVKR